MNWLKHAFAIERAADLRVDDAEAAVVRRMAAVLRRRELVGAALLLLQSSLPLQFVVSQFLLFLQPVARWFLTGQDFQVLTGLLQRRGCVEYICRVLEEAECEARAESGS